MGLGQRLSGAHDYVMHFPAGRLLPNDTFWSLTMGNARIRINPLCTFIVCFRLCTSQEGFRMEDCSNRIARLRAIATFAVLRPRRIIKCAYLRRHPGKLRTQALAYATQGPP